VTSGYFWPTGRALGLGQWGCLAILSLVVAVLASCDLLLLLLLHSMSFMRFIYHAAVKFRQNQNRDSQKVRRVGRKMGVHRQYPVPMYRKKLYEPSLAKINLRLAPKKPRGADRGNQNSFTRRRTKQTPRTYVK